MTGSGNDFVMVDGRVSTPDEWSEGDIRALCARGTGIGADGLVFVTPGSTPGSARMIYYNSDGSHAAMCGNAALCSTTLAVHLSLGPAEGLTLETDAGTYRSRIGGPGCAELNLAPVDAPQAVPGLRLAPGERQAALATVGVPHLVVLVDDLASLDLMGRGRSLRSDKALGPAGANVNFIASAQSGAPNSEGKWAMRTYERGVEGETLACGTGAVAAACALTEWGLGALPIHIETRSGRLLTVKARQDSGRYRDIWLVGEGRMVFRGVVT